MNNLVVKLNNWVEKGLKTDFLTDQFFLVFQPKICVKTSKMIGAEVLTRWHHPSYGIIPTQQWISIVQETNALDHITYWLAEKVVNHLTMPDFQDLILSMNISPRCLTEKFADFIINQLLEKKVVPGRLTLEITESQSILDLKNLIFVVKKLRKFGVKIALDDFGIGFSSMKYLVDIPVDYVKIDKEFAQGAVTSSTAKLVLRTLIELVQEVGAHVIVEGVETYEQYEMVKNMGAHYIQGYLFSKPLVLKAFVAHQTTNWSSYITKAWMTTIDKRQKIQKKINKQAA